MDGPARPAASGDNRLGRDVQSERGVDGRGRSGGHGHGLGQGHSLGLSHTLALAMAMAVAIAMVTMALEKSRTEKTSAEASR